MRRFISFLLVLCLCLSGCSAFGERIKEPVVFYYVNKDYQKNMERVIVSEIREASGHSDDLSYLLALYSMGPTEESLQSLFPRNTIIMLTERSKNGVELNLSDNALVMTDLEFTLASACLAMTCFELIDVKQVKVCCGERNITIQQDNLLLYNDMIQKSQEEAE